MTHPLISERRSPRAFDPSPLSAAEVQTLLEAARWAPSSMNEQPWRFVVASIDDPAAHADAVASLVESNQRWAARAPLLLVACAVPTFARHGRPNRHALHDVGLAVAQLTLQATALGLVVHQMGGFVDAEVRARFGVPADVEIASLIAVGRPGDPDALPDDLRERERAPRARKALGEVAFRGRWGEPVSG